MREEKRKRDAGQVVDGACDAPGYKRVFCSQMRMKAKKQNI